MLASCFVGTVPESAAQPVVVLADGNGIQVTSQKQMDPRLIAAQVTTKAVDGTLNVWILLPTGYNPSVRYPVLYLFNGTNGTASDWVEMGGAEQTTAGLPLIVVMPDASLNDRGGSWCTNWVNQSQDAANWETFHIGELVPWIDSQLPTIANRDGRAIAGLSMGGFCSMTYAARHPDLFETALSYSGAPDIAYDPVAELGAVAIINGTEIGFNGVAPDSIFGIPLTDQVNWADHDPATLAPNLRDTNLLMYNGNGFPGPLDPSPVADPSTLGGTLPAALIEGAVEFDNQFFHDRLDALGIPSYWDAYGNGTHIWPYWARDLQQSIGTVMADFAHPLPAPPQVDYTTADPDYSVYGWSITMHRAAEEFSTLQNADTEGFAVSGSGSADVVTPPSYVPGLTYEVTMIGDTVARRTAPELADASGRLHVSVPLGPANLLQEYTVPLLSVGTNVYTTTVTVAPT